MDSLAFEHRLALHVRIELRRRTPRHLMFPETSQPGYDQHGYGPDHGLNQKPKLYFYALMTIDNSLLFIAKNVDYPRVFPICESLW